MRQTGLSVWFVVGIVLFGQTIVFAKEYRKHALLIGIQDYSYHPLLTSLKGQLNDVEIVGVMLHANASDFKMRK